MATEEKIFIFSHEKYGFETMVNVPFEGSIEEFVYILITTYNLPRYIANSKNNNDITNKTMFIKTIIAEITEQLSKFILESTAEYYDNVTTSLIEKSKGNVIDLDEITKDWEKIFREVWLCSFNY